MDKSKINNEKYYKLLIHKHSEDYDDTTKALAIVKQFVIDKNLIIVGGLAIDFALRLKGEQIYSDEEVPDYDFYSTNHSEDAYELGIILCKEGIKNISCIQAYHLTTMSVRCNFETIADITYCPPVVFNNIPTLKYHKFRVIHPHYQMIDQHNSLSRPFDNPGIEVIFHRWKKDMERYDKLYLQYPVVLDDTYDYKTPNVRTSNYIRSTQRQLLAETLEISMEKIEIKLDTIKGGGCICGWGAVDYNIDEKKKILTLFIPTNEPLSIATYDYKAFIKNNDLKIKGYYSGYMGQLPQYVLCESNTSDIINIKKDIQVFDTYGVLVSAKKISKEYDIYVCNLQWAMSYLLNKVFTSKNKKIIFTAEERYLYCRRMIIENNLFPSIEYYGKHNYSHSYIHMLKNNKAKIYNIKSLQQHPPNSYINYPNCTNTKTFDTSTSYYFKLDGGVVDSFPEIDADPYPEYTISTVKGSTN
jgi:hypothetical protein